MHVSDKGRAFTGAQEGLRLRAYPDVVGVWTIGYGHTTMAGAPFVHPGMVITRVQADQILARDLVRYEDEVLREVHVPLSQCQFDALVDFTYNCGEGSLARAAFLAHLNAGNYGAVPGILMEWDRAGGRVLGDLVRRRRAEGQIFQGHYPWLPAIRVAMGARKMLGAILGKGHPA
ncbi:lysozyme [Methylovirgula sp. HY1]|uniref:lysozyme n=1 Tax=Methylovirgula sp. HY1 TaxID=2822761 RepID=UPI001C5AA74A|nr:lysozyme [Methylovirgula sp. HY1]QXX74219.1 Lysozyme RrrD [Methylovirgula sp. HY1]